MKRKNKKSRLREKSLKLKNKKLLKEYPFLASQDWWGRKIPKKFHKFTCTELDEMPIGWRRAFGKEMLKDIKRELIQKGFLNKYYVYQIKEKYGGLRWYDNVQLDCMEKYENLSYRTCINCGKPATKISKGWICPWCDDCVKTIHSDFVSIEEFYK